VAAVEVAATAVAVVVTAAESRLKATPRAADTRNLHPGPGRSNARSMGFRQHGI
jgi:hypothetical protein